MACNSDTAGTPGTEGRDGIEGRLSFNSPANPGGSTPAAFLAITGMAWVFASCSAGSTNAFAPACWTACTVPATCRAVDTAAAALLSAPAAPAALAAPARAAAAPRPADAADAAEVA